MKKIEVNLQYLYDLGLIIKCVSEISYTNISCGPLQIEKKIEGALVMLEGDHCEMISRLNTFFNIRYPDGKNGLTNEDADEIDSLFKHYPKEPKFTLPTEIVSIDRNLLYDSGEKWIHVNIENQPEKPIYNYDKKNDLYTGGYYAQECDDLIWKEFNWDVKKHPDITKDPRYYAFYGFGYSKGVITWNNEYPDI